MCVCVCVLFPCVIKSSISAASTNMRTARTLFPHREGREGEEKRWEGREKGRDRYVGRERAH